MLFQVLRALKKTGSGKLTLSGNNSSFSGGLTIADSGGDKDGGIVVAGSPNALGAEPRRFSTENLQLQEVPRSPPPFKGNQYQ